MFHKLPSFLSSLIDINCVIRIFTSVPLSSLELTGPEYRHCSACSHWVHVTNHHCSVCGVCPSKDGRTYRHCSQCGRCVKPTYQHCHQCGRCSLPHTNCHQATDQPARQVKREVSRGRGRKTKRRKHWPTASSRYLNIFFQKNVATAPSLSDDQLQTRCGNNLFK